jgi:hypothetical protein
MTGADTHEGTQNMPRRKLLKGLDTALAEANAPLRSKGFNLLTVVQELFFPAPYRPSDTAPLSGDSTDPR